MQGREERPCAWGGACLLRVKGRGRVRVRVRVGFGARARVRVGVGVGVGARLRVRVGFGASRGRAVVVSHDDGGRLEPLGLMHQQVAPGRHRVAGCTRRVAGLVWCTSRWRMVSSKW